ACGLESAVLGDVQILGQLKQGRSLAAQCGTLGPYLSRVVEEAIRVGKRARSETNISYGAASIGSALA
ncbi:MAG: glutamyl-tRNA reductase, partial [Anaerolineae bacterium]|nr:glutamyl-tRNA reductase [Anaerolineae bacterium]